MEAKTSPTGKRKEFGIHGFIPPKCLVKGGLYWESSGTVAHQCPTANDDQAHTLACMHDHMRPTRKDRKDMEFGLICEPELLQLPGRIESLLRH